MSDGKTILILGGGTGGIVAASRLRKGLGREHRIVLIERAADYLFAPSLLWLMTGLRKRTAISRPLTRLAHGIERVHGNIEAIDPLHRTVQVNGRKLSGDYLVVALGAELAPQTVPGLAEAGHNLYELAGAEALRDARLNWRAGRLIVLVSAVPFKCPAAPYEAAMLLEYDCRKRRIRDQVTIDLYTPEPGPMPVAGAEVSQQVRQIVEAKGIGYHPGHAVSRVDAGARRIEFANGAATGFDLLVYVPPHRAPQVVQDAGLCGESGWIAVDRQTLQTRFPGVYALGDVTGIMLAMGRPLPKAGVFAHGEAEVVAHNLVCALTGRGQPRQFDGHGECFVETGDGKAGFGSGDFFAEPLPQVRLRPPGRSLHLGKIAFEKFWLFEWF
ncbi:MAG: NAD(P)/FAD-dependent oxidoreductase [Gammaproteobacteria bacterium]|nr:NAD(P)/FAD-dependent oxidoreductase [Gammaproteobacteria bacterium]